MGSVVGPLVGIYAVDGEEMLEVADMSLEVCVFAVVVVGDVFDLGVHELDSSAEVFVDGELLSELILEGEIFAVKDGHLAVSLIDVLGFEVEVLLLPVLVLLSELIVFSLDESKFPIEVVDLLAKCFLGGEIENRRSC